MSTKSEKLENAVLALQQAYSAAEGRSNTRTRVAIDRAFAYLFKLSSPRIRHFIAQYGLADYREDAEQACAIAIHRAAENYDSTKAKFTTFLNWQLRGELQGLRFRLRIDQRASAKKVKAVTVSFESLKSEEGSSFDQFIVDEDSQNRTEILAANYLAERTADVLIGAYIETRPVARVKRDRAILWRHLVGTVLSDEAKDASISQECERAVVRRAKRAIIAMLGESTQLGENTGKKDKASSPSCGRFLRRAVVLPSAASC